MDDSILPYINDENVIGILNYCKEAEGVKEFSAGMGLATEEIGSIFILNQVNTPHLKDRYIREFGNSYVGNQ